MSNERDLSDYGWLGTKTDYTDFWCLMEEQNDFGWLLIMIIVISNV